MSVYWYDHVSITSPTPEATTQWFIDHFGAELRDPWTAPDGIAHLLVLLNWYQHPHQGASGRIPCFF